MTAASKAPRLPDWRARLAAVVAAAHRQPFVWGRHDCCLWAADAVRAVTGQDPAHDLRGRYDTANAALQALRGIGGLRGAGARMGAPLAGPLLAQDGDIGLVHDGRRPMLAVSVSGLWLCAATPGLHPLPMAAASAVWGVGCPR